MDLRVGTITAAERVPKADKLLKLTIDVGEAAPRTIVSGIAQHFPASARRTARQGSKVLVFVRLPT
jgi:methionyl-tRNA synthetase